MRLDLSALRARGYRGRDPLPCVYVITHAPSGRRYVGSSVWPHARVRNHSLALRRRRHPSAALQEAFDRDGDDALSVVVVEVVTDPVHLPEREAWWIAALATNDPTNGFNGPVSPVSRASTRLVPLAAHHAQITVAQLAYRNGRLSPTALARTYGYSLKQMQRILGGGPGRTL